MPNVVLTLAYDGTTYYGWQKTPAGPTIEEALQKVLFQVLQEPVILQAASRTDAGVHAAGQIVNFFTEKSPNLDRLLFSLNRLLPKDIVILTISAASPEFHPTLDCQSKEYRYHICHGPIQLPQHRNFSWHWPYAIDIHKMQVASQILIGSHDFSAFCNAKKFKNYNDYIREIYSVDIEEIEDKRIQIRVKGNHFLYKMVRNIVGLLVYVGTDRIDIEAVKELLIHKDRKKGAMTAPAHGLCLYQINY